MSSKTKIIVLHMKEVVYTAIFLVLAVLLIVLVFVMFGSHRKGPDAASPDAAGETLYVPGVYTASVSLAEQTFDVQVTVDENHINSIALINLSETVTAMYPLVEPALDDLASQIYTSQSTEHITFGDDSKYTSSLLLSAINQALAKAKAAR